MLDSSEASRLGTNARGADDGASEKGPLGRTRVAAVVVLKVLLEAHRNHKRRPTVSQQPTFQHWMCPEVDLAANKLVATSLIRHTAPAILA
ncbi:hypothetical protein V5799_006236 [Amblyomma americanum]|uniref:Uncharacterized protein n=1 Tax=Amblyomma americanum TaxID=6943 RepID=A0AAQ4DWZ2_AMBAM